MLLLPLWEAPLSHCSQFEGFWPASWDSQRVLLFKCLRQSRVPLVSPVDRLLRGRAVLQCPGKSHAVTSFHLPYVVPVCDKRASSRERPVGLASKAQKGQDPFLGKGERHLFASCFYLFAERYINSYFFLVSSVAIVLPSLKVWQNKDTVAGSIW